MTRQEFFNKYIKDVRIRIHNRHECYKFQEIAFEFGVRVHSEMNEEKQTPIDYNIGDVIPEWKGKSFATDMHNLVIYDNGTRLQESGFYGLEKEVNRLGLNGSVIWSLQEKGIDKFLDSVDVFMTVQAGNRFNYPALYAMAHSKPVIGEATGSNLELIQNKKNGFLYSNNDLGYVFACFDYFTDQEIREKFGKNARETVEKNFNFDIAIKKIESLIA